MRRVRGACSRTTSRARSGRRSRGLAGRFGGAERGRFEITQVPAQLRSAGRGPIATRYDRVTFDIEHVLDGTGARAELLAPGHPLTTPSPPRR